MIGAHISVSDGLNQALAHCDKINGNVIQIYARNPRTSNAPDIKINMEKISKYNHKIFIHSSYSSMLTKGKYNTFSIIKDMKLANKIGAIGVVVHPGSKVDYWVLVKNIKYIFNQLGNIGDVKLLLENMAETKSSNRIMSNMDDIINLFAYLKKKLHSKMYNRIGLCFDTCHRYITCNTKNIEIDFNRDFNALRKYGIPVDLVHLNNSSSKTRDCHANVFDGFINNVHMRNVIMYCKKNNIPMVIERTKESIESLKKQVMQVLDT